MWPKADIPVRQATPLARFSCRGSSPTLAPYECCKAAKPHKRHGHPCQSCGLSKPGEWSAVQASCHKFALAPPTCTTAAAREEPLLGNMYTLRPHTHRQAPMSSLRYLHLYTLSSVLASSRPRSASKVGPQRLASRSGNVDDVPQRLEYEIIGINILAKDLLYGMLELLHMLEEGYK